MGGLIGAAAASPVKAPVVAPQVPPASVDVSTLQPGYSASRLYWIVLLLASIVTCAITLISSDDQSPYLAALILALVFPGVQLGTSILVVLVLLFSKRRDRAEQLRHLGKITLYALVGGLVGFLLMVVVLRPMF